MIDTKALRSRILDLAIQGKLTEQLPSDGTAEELYQQIQAEKQALIKEGEIKREKPLPEISADEVPFEIPSNWKWVNFGDIMWNRDSERIPVSVADRKKLKKVYDYYGASGIIDKVEDYLFDKRLLLIGEDGANLLSRSTPIAFMAEGKYWVNNHAHVLDCYIENYLDFVLYYINAISLVPYVTGSAQPKLNQDRMNKIPVPLPPLAEQKRIVERVEEIFRVLDTIDQAQEKYSADSQILKAKLITAGIQGKLTKQLPSDGTAEELYQQIQAEKSEILKQRQGRKDNSVKPIEEDVPFEIPENWKWIRFGETGFFRKGPFGSSLTKSMFVPKGNNAIKVYEQQHAIKKDHTLGTYYITKEYFDESMKGFEVLADDIIISCAGTIGETFIMPDNIEKGIINQALMRVTVVPSINKDFFLYYFNSQLKKSAKDGNGSAITNIPPFDVLKNLYFPLPPLAEQKRIADVLERALGALD